MNLLEKKDDIADFLVNLTNWSFSSEDFTDTEQFAKETGLKLPDEFKGSKISAYRRGDPKGKFNITLSTLKWPFFSFLLPFLAKTKCYLICWEDGTGKMHCLHVCVSCFDGFPGPGCHIHGSYD
jgi:hypothetical protein